ncbi:MAG: hypothetical protein J5548_13215 [Prevotella sp.]|nr:hypothetical protein [Prevotella sp.]
MSSFSSLVLRILEKAAETCLFWEGKILLRQGRLEEFVNHVMDPEFDYKPYLKQVNPYYARHGFKFSMVEAEYNSRLSGVKSDLYISNTFFRHYLVPFLNGDGKNVDKNMFRKLLGNGNPRKKVAFTMAEQVTYNMNGVFYDGNDDCISPDEAVRLVMAYDKDLIVKPTLNTTWGKGVIKLSRNERSEEKVRQLFAQYRKDFSFEECVIQHPDLASLNESSLNTVRICTYRRPNGEIKYLFSILRFGEKGSVVDNASAGGNFVGVMPDGTIKRKMVKYHSLEQHPFNHALEKVPCFERLKATAIHLHSKLADLNYVGWDFSVTPDGIPVVIELNQSPAVNGFQMTVGPAFSKEDLDELLPLIKQRKVSCQAFPTITFADKRGKSARIKG